MPPDARFTLQAHLDALYSDAPASALSAHSRFTATTRKQFHAWQHTLRLALIAKLGSFRRKLPDPVNAEPLHSVDRGAYDETKFALDAGEGVQIPAYVLIPHTPPPYKPVLVFHGHNPSVQYVLGNYPDDATAEQMRAVDNNYAQALAEAGYLVCAVEQRGFGERVTPQLSGDETFTSACRHLAFEYLAQGRTLLGERIYDGMIATTFVLARDDVVPGVLGCTGNSGGGTTTLFLAALDERITVAVPGSYFCSFKQSIHAMWHCECNYVPGLLTLAEMGDIAALIAPRPFCAIQGVNDPLYPIVGGREQFETVRRAYALHGAEDRCQLAEHPGAHAYNHALSQAWFVRWL